MLKTKLKDGTPLMDFLKAYVYKKDFEIYEDKIKEKERNPSSYLGITVRKNLSMPIEDFLKICLKLPKYKWFKDYIYSIEFNTESGYFPHIHICLSKWDKISLPKADLLRNIKRIFKQQADSQIQIDVLNLDHYNKLSKYIFGEKKDLNKEPLVILDKTDRVKYDLMDYYTDLEKDSIII